MNEDELKNTLQTIIIMQSVHKLDGIDNIEYIYDREAKTLVINADGVEVRTYQGRKATSIYLRMSE